MKAFLVENLYPTFLGQRFTPSSLKVAVFEILRKVKAGKVF